ncbi:hypothetical protein DLM75_16680 [Leptospira stimsonii]|uniref:Uncharacterized protein n=1 Tax=Leptospira stimsonii TaxID=2202203 RepID=A0A396Z1V6_9LEPT|nr:hypothetical protein DLM75_16680 [Leptospira stimsonii]
MKVARPSLNLGGGVGGGKLPEIFHYHKIKLFASENIHVGIPTKYLFLGRFSFYPLTTSGYGYAFCERIRTSF